MYKHKVSAIQCSFEKQTSVLRLDENTKTSFNTLSVFALWPVVFWKYVFIQFKKVIFFKNVFLCFKKSYFNISMSKYVHKNVFSCTNLHTYAAVLCQRIHIYEYAYVAEAPG